MELDNCINYLLSTSQNKVFKHFKSLLSSYNITPAEYGVLNCLINSNLNTPKTIGNTLNLEPSTISGILDKMSKKDLIIRQTDNENRRTVLISSTNKAKDLWPTLEKIAYQLNNDYFANLTSEEIILFKKVLLKINGSGF
ncbi:MarR family winged helix-turn-helix transcriptional regulator [Mammaliicoccus vitulinus]|uniref:MarR family transcriptional regulator n=1 Tax=Mammaliicoccus vitulinus TaxID=71237 RepID=A0ABX7HHG6_9STAP|nr:MarR family transcriptional regulator [Mammaliicoccus vitulinus]PNZ40112.1 MarR family transcriptional regulator [Mammaliicoccus vitulinus]QRO86050.1 MarR family transcriptional regulator [Mammaliicoccus vitulinus]